MKTRQQVWQILVDGPFAGHVYEGFLGERVILINCEEDQKVFRYQLTACTPKHCIMQYVYVP